MEGSFLDKQPHCPKCKGKPTAGQRKLTMRQRDGLRGKMREAVSARFDSVYWCSTCRSVYGFESGFSTFLGHLPREDARQNS